VLKTRGVIVEAEKHNGYVASVAGLDEEVGMDVL
jgi:hypothetical protein